MADDSPFPLDADALTALLTALGSTPAAMPAGLTGDRARLHLAHGLVGAAERQAMASELAARATGMDSPAILNAAQEAFAAAAAASRLDVLGHVQWRATRLVQALQAIQADLGRPDPILEAATLAAAAVSALLSARAGAASGSRTDAVASLHAGATAMRHAAKKTSALGPGEL